MTLHKHIALDPQTIDEINAAAPYVIGAFSKALGEQQLIDKDGKLLQPLIDDEFFRRLRRPVLQFDQNEV